MNRGFRGFHGWIRTGFSDPRHPRLNSASAAGLNDPLSQVSGFYHIPGSGLISDVTPPRRTNTSKIASKWLQSRADLAMRHSHFCVFGGGSGHDIPLYD